MPRHPFSPDRVPLSRRSLIRTTLLAAAAPALQRLGPLSALAQPAGHADAGGWRHGLSLFGELKYPAGFKQFDYVNVDAPKKGMVRLVAVGTFDNLNPAVGAVRGSLAVGLNFLFDTLMTEALDEVSAEYGLLAEAARYPADFSFVTYRLRAEARWHDGKPVTPEDVVYSLDTLKKTDPQLAAYYRHVSKAEQTGEREVTFTFDAPGNRELPSIVGQLIVLPKHWWEASDASGNKRNVAATTLEPPLGCGPYKIKEFTPARSIVYERVKDYWGKDLPVRRGQYNFDELRHEYYRDTTVALEAFKGDQIDWRTENSAKNWVTAYDFPAVNEKRVIKEEFPLNNSGLMQGFLFNIRREKFQDPRVRRAFNFALDFEEMNKQIFFNQYKRISSFFDGTELASSGVPEGEELAILETVRGQVPDDLFTKPYTNPVGGSPEKVRANQIEAVRLFKEAGYEIRDRKLVDVKTNQPFSLEMLIDDPSSERIVLFYKPSVERLGVTMTVRMVDDAQYQNRLRNWDFDVIIGGWAQSLSPGNEQRFYWGSEAADDPGSRNWVGIKNPAVDKLIERVIFAKNRAELVAATRALDRVLLWNSYVVPHWNYPFVRSARWDRFGRPDQLPKYGASAFPIVWWWDDAKATKTGSRR